MHPSLVCRKVQEFILPDAQLDFSTVLLSSHVEVNRDGYLVDECSCCVLCQILCTCWVRFGLGVVLGVVGTSSVRVKLLYPGSPIYCGEHHMCNP